MSEKALSSFDSLSKYMAPNMRDVGDYYIDILGTWSQVIRVSVGQSNPEDAWAGNQGRDVFGDFDRIPEALGTPSSNIKFSLLDNVMIDYPDSKFEIFQKYSKQNGIQTTGISYEDNLEIEFTVKFIGDSITEAAFLKKGDLIFDYIEDETGNIVPIGLEVTQMFADRFGKQIIRKTGKLAPIRGPLEPIIQQEVVKRLKEIVV
jgi:hypothetical protein